MCTSIEPTNMAKQRAEIKRASVPTRGSLMK